MHRAEYYRLSVVIYSLVTNMIFSNGCQLQEAVGNDRIGYCFAAVSVDVRSVDGGDVFGVVERRQALNRPVEAETRPARFCERPQSASAQCCTGQLL